MLDGTTAKYSATDEMVAGTPTKYSATDEMVNGTHAAVDETLVTVEDGIVCGKGCVLSSFLPTLESSCAKVSKSNFGYMLSFVGKFMIETCHIIMSMVLDDDRDKESFKQSFFGGSHLISGKRITEIFKSFDSEEFVVCHKACEDLSTSKTCRACDSIRNSCNRLVHHSHKPMFEVHGKFMTISMIMKSPRNATHEVQSLCLELQATKQKRWRPSSVTLFKNLSSQKRSGCRATCVYMSSS